MRLTVLSFCLLLMTGMVSACGIKPNNLTPPPPAKKTDFPRVYPDPSLDPKPVPQHQQPAPQQPTTPQPESTQ